MTLKDSFWSAFVETGEPMCYLLCKAGEKKSGAEEPPRSGAARGGATADEDPRPTMEKADGGEKPLSAR